MMYSMSQTYLPVEDRFWVIPFGVSALESLTSGNAKLIFLLTTK